MGRIFLALGALAGALAVGMAATAAHALPQRLDTKALDAVRSAVQMQAWHAIALVLTGLWLMRAPPFAHQLGTLAGFGFLLGALLFCGGIYAHHLAGMATGPVAPIGGVLLILAWLLLMASALAAGPTP
jgi:uncharacterized membrane protein YgdD (TMEM256/DUF423 family)